MKPIGLLLFVGLVGCSSHHDAGLPADALAALARPERVTLYALEPTASATRTDPTLDGLLVLGKADLPPSRTATAIAAFQRAIATPTRDAEACFDPRHALRIVSKGHTFDFLLCFECHALEVYRDGAPYAGATASGSPRALNALLRALRLPVSKTGPDEGH